MKKRLLAAMLTLALVVVMLSGMTFAAGPNYYDGTLYGYACPNGSTPYYWTDAFMYSSAYATPAKPSTYDKLMSLAGMSQPFYTDVKTSAWYYADLTWLWIRGLTDAQTNFYPDALTTRGCIVEWIWRMEGRPVTRNYSFTDTTAMSAIWGGANHVVYGYSEDTFGPDDYINREQLAAIIYRYGLYNDVNLNDRGDLSAFSDAADVSDWAAEAMSWAVGTGIVEGRTDGTLDPKGTATRAEAAAMLHRASLYFGL